MGTLTGDTSSLPGHCPHKLPTSCRLTATLLCCACQDKRPHAPYYSVYVDGVGFVARGTRWEKYCWFCRAFWTQRLADSEPRITPSESRVPDYPAQSNFLQRWFECHEGFQLVRQRDGSTRREVLQFSQPWRDVAPGCLPYGVHITGARLRTDLAASRPTDNAGGRTSPQEFSLEATLDNLLDEAIAEEENVSIRHQQSEEGVPNGHLLDLDAPSGSTDEPAVARSRSASHTIRERLLHGRHAMLVARPVHPTTSEASQQNTNPSVTNGGNSQGILSEYGRAVREAKRVRDEYALRLELAEHELQAARDQLRRYQRQSRAADNYARVFGTREEVQGAEYTSPIAGMFTRAWERYGIAEEVRNQERMAVANSDRHNRLLELGTMNPNSSIGLDRSWHDHGRVSVADVADAEPLLATPDNTTGQSPQSPPLPPITNHTNIPQPHPSSETAQATDLHSTPEATLDPPNSTRPAPKSDAELTQKLACKVCFAQLADIALLPCGHLILCEWCADVQIPTRPGDPTRPMRGTAQCPLCRRSVRQRRKVFLAG